MSSTDIKNRINVLGGEKELTCYDIGSTGHNVYVGICIWECLWFCASNLPSEIWVPLGWIAWH